MSGGVIGARVTRNYGVNGDHGTVVAWDRELALVMWDHTLEDGLANVERRVYWHPADSLMGVDA